MATIAEDRARLNDMERRTNSLVKTLDGSIGYEAGDVVLLGLMPAECLVTDIRIISGDTIIDSTFDLNMLADFPDLAVTPIASAIQTVANSTNVIAMPTSGNVDTAGAGYTGDRASIWSGDNGINIGVTLVGAVTEGECMIVMSYSYYGTKDGQYGLATVPFQPSRV